jgi:hypothetical protein
VTRTQAEESDAPPVKSGRPIPHKFASRLRCLENSLYKKATLKAHQYDTQHAEHSNMRQAVSRVRGGSVFCCDEAFVTVLEKKTEEFTVKDVHIVYSLWI